MRGCVFLLLLLTVIIGCSKKNTVRTNFAELTIGGDKFVFDSLEAIFDTSVYGVRCNFAIYNRATHSSMTWETSSGSEWINGIYEYPGQYYPGRSVVFLDLRTYINWVPATYSLQVLQNTSFTLTIDQSENGRMHGTFSGYLICHSCTPYGAEVRLSSGEFEMPYSYR